VWRKTGFTFLLFASLLTLSFGGLSKKVSAAYVPECGNTTTNASWWSNVKTAVLANAGTDPDFTNADTRMIMFRAVGSTTAQIFIASPGARINLVYRDTNNTPQLEFHTPNAEWLYRTNVASDGTATTNFYSTNTGVTQQNLSLGSSGTGSCIQGFNKANVEKNVTFFNDVVSPYFPYATGVQTYMKTLFADGSHPCQYNEAISENDTACVEPTPEGGDSMTVTEFEQATRSIAGEYAVKGAALLLAALLALWTIKQFRFKDVE